MKYPFKYLLIFIIASSSLIIAQNKFVDSLKKVLPLNASDTAKVKTLILLSFTADEPDWLEFNEQAMKICKKKLASGKISEREKIFYKNNLGTAYNSLGYSIMNKGGYDESIKEIEKGLVIFLDTKDVEGLALSYSNLGALYHRKNNVLRAIENYEMARKVSEEGNNIPALISALNQLGSAQNTQGNTKESLKYYTKSVLLSEKINDQRGLANAYYSIAIVLTHQGDTAKAMEYIFKCKTIREKLGLQEELSYALQFIGNHYVASNKLKEGIEYLTKALALREKVGDLRALTMSYQNLGAYYVKAKDLKKAREYFLKSVVYAKKIGDKEWESTALNSLGNIELNEKNTGVALKNFEAALDLGKKSGRPEAIRDAAKSLFVIYNTANKNDKKALEYHLLYIKMRDSLVNAETKSATLKTQFKMEYQKKELELQRVQENKDLIRMQEKIKQAAEMDNQRTINLATILAMVLILLLVFFVYRNLRQTKVANKIISEQKAEVEKQKHLAEQKNKEVEDSIVYAKRLQEAILPPKSLISSYLPESYLLYLPKDIVAGDFYWMEVVQVDNSGMNQYEYAGKHGNSQIFKASHLKILIAAADCTGHGVPGAMVSVICSTALNRSVKEFALTEPGEILNKTRELVIETFEKSESNVKDGMDISFLSIELPFSLIQEGNTKMKWAGANNPIWYTDSGSMIEISANKQPIGKMDNLQPFKTHEFEFFSLFSSKLISISICK